MDNDKFTWDKNTVKRGFYISLIIATGLALAVAFFFLIYKGNSIAEAIGSVFFVIRPFIIGAIIAYILKPTCNAYEKLFIKAFSKKKSVNEKKIAKRSNMLAVVLTYITWVAILVGLLWIALPQVYESIYNFIQDLIRDMPMYIENGTKFIEDFKASNPGLAPYVDQAGNAIKDWLVNDLTPMLPQIGSTILLGVVDVVVFLKDFVIGLVVSVFFLAGRKTFAKKTKLIINSVFKQKHADAIFIEAKYADRMFGGFLEGKIIDSAIIAIVYYIAITLMDIPYAALLALICGVTNIIPFFGPFLGAIPSAFIILMSVDDPIKLLYFIIFVCVVQFIDGNIIDPHIVGGNINISPFCVIFAVLIFGGFWGFGGLLIGVPTFAVIYDICKKIIYRRLLKTGKKEILREHLNEFGKRKKRHVHATAAPAPSAEAASVKPEAEAASVKPEAEAAPVDNTVDANKDLSEGDGNTDNVGGSAQAADSGDEG